MFNLSKFSAFSRVFLTRSKTKLPKKQPIFKKLEATKSAISSKGFLRSFKPYTPPENVETKVAAAFTKCGLDADLDTELNDAALKFSVLNECLEVFNHSVPNSSLSDIVTYKDVLEFYKTPVNTTVPYDALAKMDLPKNLHVQHEYVRFHPETDEKFGGITAFTKSSTLVTGLKYKKKYKGYEAKVSWP